MTASLFSKCVSRARPSIAVFKDVQYICSNLVFYSFLALPRSATIQNNFSLVRTFEIVPLKSQPYRNTEHT